MTVYRKFPKKRTECYDKPPKGNKHTLCRGHFPLPEAFYGMEIGQLLAEI